MIFLLIRNEIRSGTLETSPSLGIVVSQLKNCVEYYNREKGAYDGLLRQRKALEASLNINQRGNTIAWADVDVLNTNNFLLLSAPNRSATIRDFVRETAE